MTRFNTFIATVCISMLFQIPAVQSQEQPVPGQDQKPNSQERLWSQLSPEELEQLTRDKILVTRRTYRQIFEPYLNPSTPAFITSDAIIHAFHVLFKESISRQEETNAEKLRVILNLVWERIKPKPEDPQAKAADDKNSQEQKQAGSPNSDQDFQQIRRAANTYARIVIAVALKLLGDTPTGLDAELVSDPFLVGAERQVGHDQAGLALTDDLVQVEVGPLAFRGQRIVPGLAQLHGDRVIFAA